MDHTDLTHLASGDKYFTLQDKAELLQPKQEKGLETS